MRKGLVALALLGALPFCGQLRAQDLQVAANVDPAVVGLNNTFTLSLEISSSASLPEAEPELPDMGAFAGYLGRSSSQRLEMINGRTTQSLSYQYTFRATALGSHTIGPITVTAGGKTYRTRPLSIRVRPGPPPGQPAPSRSRGRGGGPIGDRELFLRASADKSSVYVNEPVVVEFKIYTLVNVTSFGIDSPASTAGFWVEEFDLPEQPQTHSQIIDGRRYTVATIKRMALFPTSPGAKTVGAMSVDAQVRLRSSRRLRDLDPFDWMDRGLFGRSVPKRLESRPIEIEVKPFPEAGRPDDFSGVAGRLSLRSRTDKLRAQVNEALAYTLTINGEGNLRTMPRPEVDFPPDFEVYPPKVSEHIDKKGTRISGRKTYEYVLIPRNPGLHVIPSLSIGYFDLASESYRTARSDPIEVAVEGSADAAPVIARGRGEVRQLREDIRFIKTGAPRLRVRGERLWHTASFWIVALAPLLALAGAAGYRRHSDRLLADVAYARRRRATKLARRRLSKARSLQAPETQKEFYAEVGKALMGFLADKLNIAEAGMVSEQVKPALREKGVSGELVQEYFDCIHVCDRKRFSPSDATAEEMSEFIGRAQAAMSRLDREVSR